MAIECRKLRKQYGDIVAVDDIDITFEDSSLNVLIGPSGCGKTTTLKMLNRLIERTGGDILFDGVSMDDMNRIELRRGIGYVIQEIGLFPHMSIYENIAVVPRLLNWPEEKITKRVRELLSLVNLEPDSFIDRFPAQLSGGQRQRIGVARGLAADPKVLLMDEPFGAIDPINREVLQDSFLQIQQDIHKTIVFVTHDIREAIKLGDKIAILNKGKIVQYDDTMTIIHDPLNRFVEDILGSDRGLKGLELIHIKDTYDKNFYALEKSQETTVGDVLKDLEKNSKNFGFLVDGNRRLNGFILHRDLKHAKKDEPIDKYIKRSETIQPFASLMDALSLMFTSALAAVPVVNDKNTLLGVVRFNKVLEKVEEITLEIQEEQRKEG